MMRADCLVRPMDHHWSNSVKCEEKERQNDSGISPGRSSSDATSSSPHSPQRTAYVPNAFSRVSPDSQRNGGSPHSPTTTGAYPQASPHSPSPYPSTTTGNYPSSPGQGNNSDTQEGPLERLKMALERSTALSGIFKTEVESQDADSQQDQHRKEYPCPLCAYTSPYKHRYMEHLGTHYADKCTLCDFSGKNANDLRTHLSEVHNISDLVDLVDPTDANSDGLDDEDTPGKRAKCKTFKCKQCSFVTNTKLEFWDHTKTHIKAEKLLTCPKCPFVTEYKHHLEYHLRNHFGSKPFKCPKCAYSCVNKSMLNSHMKSHSNVYQYRCADCAYATKYCHSLKLHLRKYEHNPAMVLNADGSPNPLPIIDVYGTRRGPKQKNKLLDSPDDSSQTMENLPGGIVVPAAPQTSPKHYAINNNIEDRGQMTPPKFLYCSLCDFYTISFDILNQHMILHASESPIVQMFRTNNNIADHALVKDYFQNVFQAGNETPMSPISLSSQLSPHGPREASPLDLSKPEGDGKVTDDRPSDGKKNRRKGKAYKLERPADLVEVKMEVPDETFKIKIPEFKVKNKEEVRTEEDYNCGFCDISFRDIVMYTMHMGYHGYQDPFTCNMCGQVTPDKVAFFLHIARSSHT